MGRGNVGDQFRDVGDYCCQHQWVHSLNELNAVNEDILTHYSLRRSSASVSSDRTLRKDDFLEAVSALINNLDNDLLNDEKDYGLIAILFAIGRLSLFVILIVIVAVLYQNLLDLFHDGSVASFLNLDDINLGYLDYIVIVVVFLASLEWREDFWSW